MHDAMVHEDEVIRLDFGVVSFISFSFTVPRNTPQSVPFFYVQYSVHPSTKAPTLCKRARPSHIFSDQSTKRLDTSSLAARRTQC